MHDHASCLSENRMIFQKNNGEEDAPLELGVAYDKPSY